MTQVNPSGDNELLGTDVATRKITRFERFLGPENYRILQGMFKTPASIAGFTLIILFVIVALCAILAPPVITIPIRSRAMVSSLSRVTWVLVD